MGGSDSIAQSEQRCCHWLPAREHYDEVWSSNFSCFYNAYYFSSVKITEFSYEKGIKLHYLKNYYPQVNGLAESINKNLIWIMKKIVIEN